MCDFTLPMGILRYVFVVYHICYVDTYHVFIQNMSDCDLNYFSFCFTYIRLVHPRVLKTLLGRTIKNHQELTIL